MLSEGHVVKAYQEARRKEGNTSQYFMQLLECRLDNVVYRLRFARTIFGAQQLVSHGHILVDGKKVDRRSFLVRPGMEISIRDKSRTLKCVVDAMETSAQRTPDYFEVDKENFKGKLLMAPTIEQIEGHLALPINIPTVCEFLAHRA
jgi:small subunit ribosomal protein S4